MNVLFRLKAFVIYWLEAVDKHSLHSPFFFDFYTGVIRKKSDLEIYQPLESLRKRLLNNHETISINDLGARGLSQSHRTKKISDIANNSLTPPRFSALYQRIIEYYDAKNILELGTSLGITTLYLSTKSDSFITTLEGSATIAAIALQNFDGMGAKNISLQEGDIESTLPAFLQKSAKLDVVFMDANHRYEPTLRYFDWILKKIQTRSIIIVDDIHYSNEMERAWTVLRNHDLVYGSADLYRCGLLFFDPSLNKQHVVLQF